MRSRAREICRFWAFANSFRATVGESCAALGWERERRTLRFRDVRVLDLRKCWLLARRERFGQSLPGALRAAPERKCERGVWRIERRRACVREMCGFWTLASPLCKDSNTHCGAIAWPRGGNLLVIFADTFDEPASKVLAIIAEVSSLQG